MAAPHPDVPAAQHTADPRRLLAAHHAAAVFYRAQLDRAAGPRRYLTGRGLGVLVDRDQPWRVGYAPPGWITLTRHLRSGGFTNAELVAAGLSTRTRDDRLVDTFRDRVVFPVRDPGGHTVAFIGRAGPAAGDTVPKYLNSPDTAVYTKGSLLFGMAEQHDRISAGWLPVLVEGPTDTVAVWLSHSRGGPPGAVALAPCGTAITETQAVLLRHLPGAGIGLVVAFDADQAGVAAAERAWQLLRTPAPPGPLLAATFTTGADPADLLRHPAGRQHLRTALQQTRPLVDTVVDHRLDILLARHPRLLDDIEGRAAAVRTLTPLLFQAPTRHDAVRLARHLAQRTRTGADTVTTAMAEHVDTVVHQLATEATPRQPSPRHEPARPPSRTTAGSIPPLPTQESTMDRRPTRQLPDQARAGEPSAPAGASIPAAVSTAATNEWNRLAALPSADRVALVVDQAWQAAYTTSHKQAYDTVVDHVLDAARVAVHDRHLTDGATYCVQQLAESAAGARRRNPATPLAPPADLPTMNQALNAVTRAGPEPSARRIAEVAWRGGLSAGAVAGTLTAATDILIGWRTRVGKLLPTRTSIDGQPVAVWVANELAAINRTTITAQTPVAHSGAAQTAGQPAPRADATNEPQPGSPRVHLGFVPLTAVSPVQPQTAPAGALSAPARTAGHRLRG